MEEKEIGHGDKVAHVEGGQPLASNSEYNLAVNMTSYSAV